MSTISDDDDFPSAKECMKTIAVAEAEKASEYMRRQAAAEAEKKALVERFEKPSGVSDEERLKRAKAIVKRAVNNGMTEVQVIRFPNTLCTDNGRAINQMEPGWENTLTDYRRSFFSSGIRICVPAGIACAAKSWIGRTECRETSA